MAQPDQRDLEARVDERDDLLDRIDGGDSAALGELFEHATGAKVRSVKCHSSSPRRSRNRRLTLATTA